MSEFSKRSPPRVNSRSFASIVQDRIGALVIGADPFFFMQRDRLVALSMRHAVPTMYFFREFVTAGGLISYGTRLIDGYHQLGVYAGKILKGAKPADLPITQQSEKIELVVNLKTAKALANNRSDGPVFAEPRCVGTPPLFSENRIAGGALSNRTIGSEDEEGATSNTPSRYRQGQTR